MVLFLLVHGAITDLHMNPCLLLTKDILSLEYKNSKTKVF
jgi:hypothetical protein